MLYYLSCVYAIVHSDRPLMDHTLSSLSSSFSPILSLLPSSSFSSFPSLSSFTSCNSFPSLPPFSPLFPLSFPSLRPFFSSPPSLFPFPHHSSSDSSYSYAKIHIPIIASVSEHQPTTWTSFFFDLHVLVCVFPAGLWFIMKYLTDERVFGEQGREGEREGERGRGREGLEW